MWRYRDCGPLFDVLFFGIIYTFSNDHNFTSQKALSHRTHTHARACWFVCWLRSFTHLQLEWWENWTPLTVRAELWLSFWVEKSKQKKKKQHNFNASVVRLSNFHIILCTTVPSKWYLTGEAGVEVGLAGRPGPTIIVGFAAANRTPGGQF